MADPFEHMLPLSNETWDIQVQRDFEDSTEYNIGWYFAKATENTIEYFKHSYSKWNETRAWDQAFMNDIGGIMEFEEGVLRVNHLNLTYYKVSLPALAG